MRIGRGAMMEEKGRVEMNALCEGRGLQFTYTQSVETMS